MKPLTWAIIGPGAIAHQFAAAQSALGRQLYAVGARNRAKGEAFAQRYGIERVFDDIPQMLADPHIDAVYISTPHASHFSWMKQALEQGKHLLVEKAITVSSDELNEINRLAAEKQLIVAEAMTLFHMPLFHQLKALIESGKLGKLKTIQVSFGTVKEADPSNRFFNPALAGGALLDIGTYALSFARFFLSEQPNQLYTTVSKFSTGVDEQCGILLQNSQNEMVTISLAFRAKMPKRGIVACERGFITVEDFPRAQQAQLSWADGTSEILEAGETDRALQYEILALEKYAAEGANPLHYLTNDVVALMSDIRQRWGIRFPFEP
ncbi:Gfo/Idh/MocA family oxidoreductase [Erwinia sp. PK3-005]|uniref:Gfo/Idh/MocA family oxidoreductase n=1 Tax=Mixta hanseatica TaxID=2872648 RepID=A0ABY4RCS7_9GAMM|nr:Gfo/Idh/MocA family oxidoreductase [Mixta hanseatica]UQY45492.1 Gfo/Idh/MocA family oxidoreductase [Mixta hanseatica]